MPRVSKRLRANRQNLEVARRKFLADLASPIAEVPDTDTTNEDNSDPPPPPEIEPSIPETDILPLKNPVLGWTHAERQIRGYSKTNTGKTRQSKWYLKKKKEGLEKKTEELRSTYGDISRWFSGTTGIASGTGSNVTAVNPPGPNAVPEVLMIPQSPPRQSYTPNLPIAPASSSTFNPQI